MRKSVQECAVQANASLAAALTGLAPYFVVKNNALIDLAWETLASLGKYYLCHLCTRKRCASKLLLVLVSGSRPSKLRLAMCHTAAAARIDHMHAVIVTLAKAARITCAL